MMAGGALVTHAATDASVSNAPKNATRSTPAEYNVPRTATSHSFHENRQKGSSQASGSGQQKPHNFPARQVMVGSLQNMVTNAPATTTHDQHSGSLIRGGLTRPMRVRKNAEEQLRLRQTCAH